MTQRLGAYTIESRLGVGGMGEVWLATDSRLARQVAIKVLPPAVADDAERLARFEREARVLASLNHPNIAAIYGFEREGDTPFLVLEYVPGPTLSKQEPDDALRIAVQICDALEAAHEKGIVHRDLKPANIKLTPEGKVKVLDFGLAKALTEDPAQSGSLALSQSPTLTAHATRAGVILGTAAYMAPEQARGKTVDKRADIWAFGCVLYEMLTGAPPFAGETITDILAAVVRHEPSLDALPAEVREVVKRCLAKDPADRYRDIGDVRYDLLHPATSAPVAAEAPQQRRTPWLAIAGIAALAGAAVTWTALRPKTAPAAPLRHFQIAGLPDLGVPQFSPDGRMLAFAAKTGLWVRALDAAQPRLLAGTESSDRFCWYDASSLAYLSGEMVKRIDIASGATSVLAPWKERTFACAANSRGVLLLGSPDGISRLDPGSEEPKLILKARYAYPNHFTADDDHFLFRRYSRDGMPLAISSLSAPSPPADLDNTVSHSDSARPDGKGAEYVFYVRNETLLARPLDAAGRRWAGPGMPVATGVRTGRNLSAWFAASPGVVVWMPGGFAGSHSLVRVDRSGKVIARIAEELTLFDLDLSTDGKRVSVTMSRERGSNDQWMFDVATGQRTRATFGPGTNNNAPVFSPDGKALAYSSDGALRIQYVDGRPGRALLPATKHANDWSPDGRWLLYDDHTAGRRQDLIAMTLDGSAPPVNVAVTPADETMAQFSPDGKWVVYGADDSGSYEIFVVPFPPTGARWQVSAGGGLQPQWRGDGKELFYVTGTGDERAVVAVSVKAGKAFEAGPPRELFRYPVPGGGGFRWGASPDGQSFVMVGTPERSQQPLEALVNWSTLLKK